MTKPISRLEIAKNQGCLAEESLKLNSILANAVLCSSQDLQNKNVLCVNICCFRGASIMQLPNEVDICAYGKP